MNRAISFRGTKLITKAGAVKMWTPTTVYYHKIGTPFYLGPRLFNKEMNVQR